MKIKAKNEVGDEAYSEIIDVVVIDNSNEEESASISSFSPELNS